MIKKKYACFAKVSALLILGSCIALGSSINAEAKVITFKDKNFENFVLKQTMHSTADYTDEELNAYRYLNLYNMNEVWSLDGIQNFPRIWSVNIWQSSIADLTPISGINNITELNIRNSCISDLTPIKNLKAVKKLTCYNLNLEDYSAIASLTNLEYLELDNCNIKDLSILKNLKKLKSLKLKNNYLEDISVLSSLSELRTIWLDNNEIKDISPLLNLPSYNGKNDTSSYAKEITLNENMIDNDENTESGKALKSLESKGFKVICESKKNDKHVIKINDKRYISSNISNDVNTSHNVLLEYNEDISDFANNYSLKVYENNRSVEVPFSVQGNMLSVNLNGRCVDKDFISLAVWAKDGGYLYSIIFNKDTSLKGDMDGNGKIELNDLAQICKDYNKNSKDAHSWDIRADVNRDGLIDIYDIVEVSSEIN